ncbi:hypothetical protein BYT27DRAFT_7193698, partial [Phlegmacium glaucopus]
ILVSTQRLYISLATRYTEGIDHTPPFSSMATCARLATSSNCRSSNCVLDTSGLGFCVSVLVW